MSNRNKAIWLTKLIPGIGLSIEGICAACLAPFSILIRLFGENSWVITGGSLMAVAGVYILKTAYQSTRPAPNPQPAEDPPTEFTWIPWQEKSKEDAA